MINQEFNFDDYLSAMEQMKKLGPLNKLMEMIPGANTKELQGIDFDEGEKTTEKTKAIIYSMTVKERKNPSCIISPSRKKRIA